MNALWFAQQQAAATPGPPGRQPSSGPWPRPGNGPRPDGAPGPGQPPARGRLATVTLAAGLVAVALNLRIGVASVGPVLTSIRADLGLSAAVASLLTTIPVVAFGAFAFLAPWLTRRLDMHQLLGLAMAALAAGIGLRRQPGVACLFAGTVVVGAAIALANVVMPAVIKHNFPRRVGPWMSVYSTALFLSAAIADGLTVPLLPVVGGHWRLALALWTFPAVGACLLWLPQFFRPAAAGGPPRPGGGGAAAGGPPFRAILADPVAIAVTAFMGIQSVGYYVTLTWLPTLLQDHGMNPHAAGWMLSFSAFPGIAAALVSPALARRVRPAWVMIVLSVLCYGAAYAGLAVAPTRAPYLWMTLLGLGQGASISLALSYMAWRSPDAGHTAQVSTMAQGFGYLVASLGPIGIGALHAVSGSWTLPLAVLAALLVPQLAAGVLASRDRLVLARPVVPAPRPTARRPPAGEQAFEPPMPPPFEPLGFAPPGFAPPGFRSPGFTSPGFAAPAPTPPAFELPGFEPPVFAAPAPTPPGFAKPGFEPPGFAAPEPTPSAFETPGFEAPVFRSPALETPVLGSPVFSAPTSADEADEAPGDHSRDRPWDDSRDWFTPARQPRSPHYSEAGRPASGREHRHG